MLFCDNYRNSYYTDEIVKFIAVIFTQRYSLDVLNSAVFFNYTHKQEMPRLLWHNDQLFS